MWSKFASVTPALGLFLCKTYLSRVQVFISTEEKQSSETPLTFPNYPISSCVNIGSRECKLRRSHPRCPVKKVFLKILQNSPLPEPLFY